MNLTTRLLLVALSCLAAPGHGDTGDTRDGMETIIVTGSRLPETTPASLSTLARNTIEQINPPSTVALLEQVPHLLVSQNGGPAGHSFVSIRGGEPNFTLVMIDGVAVNDPTNSRGGGFDFNQLDPAAIERIDVYRGGVSAIYGGEAVSGVIHFITRRAGSSSVAVEVGNDQQRRLNVTLATPDQGDYSALASLSENRESPSGFSDYRNRQALLKLSADKTDSYQQLLFTASQTDNRALAEDSGGNRFASPRIPEIRDNEQWLASWRGRYRAANNRQWHARLSWSRHREEADNPGIEDGILSGIPPSEIESDYRRVDGELYLDWQPEPDWSVVAGVSGYRARGENAGTMDFGFPAPVDFELRQRNYGLFAETSKSFSALSLALGLRYDAPADFDNELSSRLSLSYQLSPGLDIHAAYSEGYKLPSFFALAHPLIGNPDLEPELSKNSEIGIRIQTESGYRTQVSLFHNRFKDLVDFDPVLFLSVNRSRVTASGLEWQASGDLTDWLSASFDVTYLDVDLEGTNSKLRRRPQWSGGVRLHAQLGDLDVTLAASSRSHFYDSSIATGAITSDGYTNVRLASQWQVSESISLSLNLDNLLDEKFEQSVGFTDPGRQFRVGLRYRL